MADPNFIPNAELAMMQAQQQSSPIPSPYLPQVPMQRETISDTSFIVQTDPELELVRLEKSYRGEVQKSNGEWEVNEELKMMNEVGIRSIMSDIRPVASPNAFTSFLEDDDIRKIVMTLGSTVTWKIAMRWREFGVDKANARSIVMMAVNIAFITLKRAQNAKTLNTFGTIRQEVVRPDMPMLQQKRKFLGIFG